MRRDSRTQPVTAIHHVTARAPGRQPLFRDDADRSAFTQLLGAHCVAHGLAAVAWCLMRNHLHLVLCGRDDALEETLQRLGAAYARRRGAARRVGGDLFRDRCQALRVNRDAYLLEVVRYVLLNPVRAGLCPSAADWRWSSARETLGLKPAPAWLDCGIVYDLLGPRDGRSPQRLRQLLDDGRAGPSGTALLDPTTTRGGAR